ncbi:ferritin-like protein [Nonomuraea sp. K274]|uniref:Ferritin-like protein n=1 Tax=Nonomuraea cypriaca TaxID=1187855 RepID=A0A931A8A5_9ACTN|nr:ferritin-like protein [Nonomuraea cypriaca]MBF8185279.1 ferritin-like protein [Nonomuraea cypriaca]
MKTLREYVEARILSPDDLKGALRLAMRLEFATIPPYLCAQWSVKHDPDRTEGVVHRVVSQEMYHFALAGNLLTAVGGTPSVAHADFLPVYPANELPGGIPQQLPIDLKPLVKDQIAVFMQIEHPDFPPVARLETPPPPTIGAFYDTIIETFRETCPGIDPDAHAVEVPFAGPIRTVADAIETIDRIKSEGEGLPDSPGSPTGERTSHAHYYLYKELYVGRRLIKTGDEWSFTGAPITLPEVYHFEPSTAEPELSLEFRRILTRLLTDLESCWTSGAAPNVPAMFELKIAGQALIKRGIRPEFTWAEARA